MVIGGIETLNQNRIANRFNKIFPEIGPKLSSSIPTYSKDFKQFMEVSETVLQEYNLQDEEFEEAFNSLLYHHLLLIFASAVFFMHPSGG